MTQRIESALQRLLAAIPPPTEPLFPSGTTETDFPMDYLQLINKFGSGLFDVGGAAMIRLINPFEPGWNKIRDRDVELLRYMKRTEGDDRVPYGIWPESPGLLPWASGDSRQNYFWLTKGPPDDWPVVTMYDVELFNEFELTATEFIQKLLCCEIDSAFLGEPLDKMKRKEKTFEPRRYPANEIA